MLILSVHSGAAISAIVWLILFSVEATIELTRKKVRLLLHTAHP